MYSRTDSPQFDTASPVVVSVAADTTTRALDRVAAFEHHPTTDPAAALSLVGQIDCVVVDAAGVDTLPANVDTTDTALSADATPTVATRETDSPALAVVEAVRRRSAHVPIVLVTDGEPAVVRDALARGVTAHVRRGDGTAFADALATRVDVAVEHAETERDQLRTRTAVETRGTAVAAVDAAGRFEAVDAAYRALVAREESTLVGAPLSAAHPEGDAERLRVAAHETDPTEEWAGTVLAVRGETPVRLRVVLTPRPDNGGFTLLATRAADPPVLGNADSRR